MSSVLGPQGLSQDVCEPFARELRDLTPTHLRFENGENPNRTPISVDSIVPNPGIQSESEIGVQLRFSPFSERLIHFVSTMSSLLGPQGLSQEVCEPFARERTSHRPVLRFENGENPNRTLISIDSIVPNPGIQPESEIGVRLGFSPFSERPSTL